MSSITLPVAIPVAVILATELAGLDTVVPVIVDPEVGAVDEIL